MLAVAAADVLPLGADPSRPARRARPARRVVRPRRRVAVGPPQRHARARGDDRGPRGRPRSRRSRRRSRAGACATGIAAVLTILALLVVWVALVAPDQLNRLTPGAFVRLPLEGLVVVALALVLPASTRRLLACVVGPVLGLLVIVKILDMGFFEAFDRPFDPVADGSYTGIGIETLRDSIGRTQANLLVAGAALLGVGRARPHDPGGASPDPGRGRPPPLVAPGRHGARRRLGALLGVRRAARLLRADRLHERRRPGLPRGPRGAGRRRGPRGLRRRDPPRPLPRHPGRPAADRPARQGRPARVRRELREGRDPGLLVLARVIADARQGHQAAAGRRLLRAQRLPHLVDVRRAQLAGALHHAVGGLGRQPAALRPARQDATA